MNSKKRDFLISVSLVFTFTILIILGINFALIYWITKIVTKAGHGLMHYDFLIYEMKNKESYICMIIILVFILKDIY